MNTLGVGLGVLQVKKAGKGIGLELGDREVPLGLVGGTVEGDLGRDLSSEGLT